MTLVDDSNSLDESLALHSESPYRETGIVYLDVGTDRVQFGLHRNVLSQCDVLSAKLSPQSRGPRSYEAVALPELDEPTAHTLVHYLYSGRYQALHSRDASKENISNSYKVGTCVYCAAVRYKLPGLADLAKEKITGVGETIPIFDILSVARDVGFRGLPEDEVWYPKYLEDAIKRAASGDPSLFTSLTFASQIEGDPKFRQVVFRAMVESLSKPSTLVEPHTAEAAAPVTEDKPEDNKAEATPRNDNTEDLIDSLSSTADTAVPEPEVSEAPREESVAFDSVDPYVTDSVEPVVSTPAIEPATDELGWGNSKTYQKYGKKVDAVVEVEVPVVEEDVRPTHKRTDSAIQVVEAVEEASPAANEKAESPQPISETLASPSMEEVPGGEAVAPKKKKGKKKKGTNATAPAPAPAFVA